MPCRAARRLHQHLGRRGIFLLLLGIGKTCFGIMWLTDPPGTQGLQLLTRFCDIRHWSWLWITAGLITAASSILPVGRDRFGFVAALIPPSVWTVAYLTGIILGEYSQGLWFATWYLTSHVGVIMWAATVPEYSVPPAPRRARRGKGG
ncbi:hypothetical protein [Streptomyces lavendofoliae]|uniref:Uncharacterized protein n=1 Tax=Streptomyces lavendofoliae TaxID=67314 RepID=A0A918M657_9ACTN|nr:hypothetical protein [Streptomyces lavendofoliae]GGU54642.1 hypothetical protein GCM10010274_49420 [Streptomyces lavendofoliae]